MISTEQTAIPEGLAKLAGGKQTVSIVYNASYGLGRISIAQRAWPSGPFRKIHRMNRILPTLGTSGKFGIPGTRSPAGQ